MTLDRLIAQSLDLADQCLLAGLGPGRAPPLAAHGMHGGRRTGPGDAFWQYRDAQPGDGLRDIDWRRSGRSDGLFVPQKERAMARTLALWVDHSPSMAWRGKRDRDLKLTRARLLALALAALTLKAGEHVRIGLLRPFMGIKALPDLARALLTADQPNPAPGCHAMVALSDFLDPPEIWQAHLGRPGLPVVLAQILDPDESSFPYEGRVRFEGTEGEACQDILRAQDIAADYRQALTRQQNRLDQWCRGQGGLFCCHLTHETPLIGLSAMVRGLAW